MMGEVYNLYNKHSKMLWVDQTSSFLNDDYVRISTSHDDTLFIMMNIVDYTLSKI